MYKEISIEQYLQGEKEVPLIDVRSPKEYKHGHIPGAINLPLFNDGERAIVGITYKEQGREEAIRKGLQLVSTKISDFVDEAKALSKNKAVMLHCWRGGMRSKSLAILYDFAGIETQVIKGGYKSYRREAKKSFLLTYHMVILGGKTGSAKTKILHALKKQGEQILDLEKLANHKGSAFGDLGENAQPSTEMFENFLFEQLQQLDPIKRIWVEDESHLIGTVFIPEDFWKQMRNAPVVYCDFPIEERVQYLVTEYGVFEKYKIIEAVRKITNRLGGENAKAALEAFAAGNLQQATGIVLSYYDKTYNYGLSQRKQENIIKIEMGKIDPDENAKYVIQMIDTKALRRKEQEIVLQK